MSLTVTVPNEYGYVVLVATGSFVLNIYHFILTSKHRKLAKIPYPTAYAPTSECSPTTTDASGRAKYLFNCAQRAHANFIESQPTFLASLLISGIAFPLVSAGLGSAWLVGRTLYARGYTADNEKNYDGRGRLVGSWASAPILGLLGLCAFTGVQLLRL